MKFKYKKYGPILRPVIPIELISNNISVPYEALVDSGADMCIFDAELGEIFGLDITKGEEHKLTGATGFVESFYIHPITIKVGGWEYKIKAGFLANIASNGYGIVGQRGFFDIFVVKFDLVKEEVELKERKK